MGFTASSLLQQDAVNSAVLRVEKDFTAQVARIGHSFGEDATGAPAIFFRVLVRDDASLKARLREFAQRLAIALMNEARTDENGLRAYFDFRSVSEQQKLQDPDWD